MSADPEHIVFWATGIGLALKENAQRADHEKSLAVAKTAAAAFHAFLPSETLQLN